MARNPKKPATGPEPATKLLCKRLSFVDDAGRELLVLSVDGGTPSIELADERGTVRARLAVDVAGKPCLALLDESGGLRAGLRLTDDDEPIAFFSDPDGTPRLTLGLEDGCPNLLLSDAAGVRRVGVAAAPNGAAGLVLYDSEGRRSAFVGAIERPGEKAPAADKAAGSASSAVAAPAPARGAGPRPVL